jgi:tetratricopeptide (TPR) repeat protein
MVGLVEDDESQPGGGGCAEGVVTNNDFELEIGSGGVPGEFVVRVLRAPVGGEPRAALQVDVEGWLGRRFALEQAVVLSGSSTRSRLREVEQPLREAGVELFDSVFTGEIASVYRASLAEAARQERTLRVVLRLTEPELAVLPWEALYDSSRRAYVCRKDEVVRHVPAPFAIAPVPVDPPLRILGLVASPRGLAPLATDDEQERLQAALAGPIAEGLIELAWVEPASWSRVHERLLRGPWHVVHFIGHGDYDHDTDEGTLALVGEDGRANWVEASRMVDLLGMARPMPRLVVLNSCASAQAGEQELISGTAATLVHSGIAAVAAMQFTITDRAAIEFPRGFYTALVAGKTVDEAVRSGRTEILGIGRDTLEWVTPVLYVRGDTSRLFDMHTAVGTPPPAERAGGRPEAGQRPTRPEGDPDPSPRRPGATGPRPGALDADPAWTDALEAFYAGRWDDAADRLQALADLHPGEGRLVSKLAEAHGQRDLAAWSAEADAAIDQHRWKTALDALQRIVSIDPTYRDAAARLEHARHEQRRHDVLEEIVALHSMGRWQAVLEAAARLNDLDPDTTDVDGLVAEARHELAEADLARRYRRAIELLERRQWQAAIDELEAITRDRPHYRDSAGLVATARHRLEGSASRPGAPPTMPPPPSGGRRRPWSGPPVAGSHVPAPRVINVGQWVRCVAFSPDGGRLATGSRQRLRVWSLTTGELAWEKKTGGWYQDVNAAVNGKEGWAGGWSNDVKAVMFCRDGTRITTASGKTARVWDANAGEELLTITQDHGVCSSAFSPDGARIATASPDKTARIWDATAGEELLAIRHANRLSSVSFGSFGTFGTFGVAFSPDGRRLATASGGRAARVWDASSGAELLTVEHAGTVFDVAFSPDGKRLATASDDKTARVWDATSGDELLVVEQAGAVLDVAFGPDGTRIATASADHNAQVWDVSTGRGMLNVRHGDRVFGVAFSPDGTRLATASGDKTVRISSLTD